MYTDTPQQQYNVWRPSYYAVAHQETTLHFVCLPPPPPRCTDRNIPETASDGKFIAACLRREKSAYLKVHASEGLYCKDQAWNINDSDLLGQSNGVRTIASGRLPATDEERCLVEGGGLMSGMRLSYLPV